MVELVMFKRLQMVCEDGENLKFWYKRKFDDAQNALKIFLHQALLKKSYKKIISKLSAANSVNFGRIIFK